MFAKQNLSPRPWNASILLRPLVPFVLALALLAPRLDGADSLEESARALARRVAAAIRGNSVTLELRNLSSLEGTEFSSVSAAFQDELQRRGVKTVPADASLALAVNVTQSPTEYIGVVQIQRKDNPETFLENLGPVRGLTESAAPSSLELHRELLFVQDTPILDVIFTSNPTRALALGPQEINSYELQSDHWVLKETERLPLHQAPRRSGRGYLATGIDSETAYLPDEVCTMVLQTSAKGWNCEKNNAEVPVRPITQDAMMGKKTGAWFSAAQFEADAKSRLAVTGQDGLARVFGEGREPVAMLGGWGGEIAGVHSGCGSGWQLLVTSAGDWTTADTIQAVEIHERRAAPISTASEFPGAILVLHTPGISGAESASASAKAIAVARNLQTDRYEAYLLSISCAQ